MTEGRRVFTLALVWVIVCLNYTEFRQTLFIHLSWLMISLFFSVGALDAVNTIRRNDPRPKQEDLFSLLVLIPCSGLLAKWLLVVVFEASLISYGAIFWSSLWVAALYFLVTVSVFSAMLGLGKRFNIRCELGPEEKTKVAKKLSNIRFSNCFNLDYPTTLGADMVLISRRLVRELPKHQELLKQGLLGVPVQDYRKFLADLEGRIDLEDTDAWSFLEQTRSHSIWIRVFFIAKSLLEPVIATVGLIVLAPVLLLLMLIIRAESPGAPIFSQNRLGYRGRPFWIYKLRTMRPAKEGDAPRWATEESDRITAVGKFLRKSRLDELPQLFNVMRGELSFVGPRPERPEFYELLAKDIPLFQSRLIVKPGLTGWAQVSAGYVSGVAESKMKLEYDAYYIRNMSPALDLLIWIQTIGVLIRGGRGR
jgi:lipopolysaccharide/colanic/teichoic acid biosynthesis glycosyltransferase